MCVYSLSYPAFNAHVQWFHLWPIQPLSYFPCYLTNSTIFGGKLLKTKCVFWFSLQLFSETFVILRRTELETSCIYKRLHVKYPLFYHTLTNLELSRLIFENYSNKKKSVLFIADRLTDGQTDRHDEAKSRFSQFCEHAQKLFLLSLLEISHPSTHSSSDKSSIKIRMSMGH